MSDIYSWSVYVQIKSFPFPFKLELQSRHLMNIITLNTYLKRKHYSKLRVLNNCIVTYHGEYMQNDVKQSRNEIISHHSRSML